MEKKTYYITTPIYYPSDNLHIGHAYTTVAGDVISRYKKIQGYDVFYLTGTDEHGQKIEKKAQEKGVEPQVFVDEIVEGIKHLWSIMDIDYDKFIRTTDEDHKQRVQKIFQKMLDKGDIYKGMYEGYYCTPCESFFTETQLEDGMCPDCNREVTFEQEESYFFAMSKYTDKLLKFYEDNPTFIEPENRKTEMINNFIKPGLQDLAVSRTSFKWGIPVPGDEEHVIYVWLDALSNYITALGYDPEQSSEMMEKFWPANVHLVGKEIVRFHTIYWPIFLMSLELTLPEQVFAHGWLLMKDGKMSKSKGNVVDPIFLTEEYGVDAVRFFLMREVPFGADGVFTPEAFVSRVNTDLANDLGNLVNRSLNMIVKYFDGQVPAKGAALQADEQLREQLEKTMEGVSTSFDNSQFSVALENIWNYIAFSNKYIDLTEPWVLAKEEKTNELATVMNSLYNALHDIATLIQPFMPNTSKQILDQLNSGEELLFDKIGNYNVDGVNVSKPEPIFPRLDVEEEIEKIKNEMTK